MSRGSWFTALGLVLVISLLALAVVASASAFNTKSSKPAYQLNKNSIMSVELTEQGNGKYSTAQTGPGKIEDEGAFHGNKGLWGLAGGNGSLGTKWDGVQDNIGN